MVSIVVGSLPLYDLPRMISPDSIYQSKQCLLLNISPFPSLRLRYGNIATIFHMHIESSLQYLHGRVYYI